MFLHYLHTITFKSSKYSRLKKVQWESFLIEKKQAKNPLQAKYPLPKPWCKEACI